MQINLLYQDMMRKKQELEQLQRAGKFKYEYDSDEETEGGTWEHRLRHAEMEATELWADELTKKAEGKHHIGDFLPPDELERFMEKYTALKDGRTPDLSDYKEFKLKEDNIGFQMLQKLGWTEGQGLGSDGSGIVDPVNKASTRPDNQGLGLDRPDDVLKGDDEYDAYRKRMMLAYRFRPNPLVISSFARLRIMTMTRYSNNKSALSQTAWFGIIVKSSVLSRATAERRNAIVGVLEGCED
uniref:G-patch domain-containing protein n=1 Tax=Timema douglasi TaxID=61478 RepID=A0A7R8VSB3_TIMDO|nr:unnamed protein product [Timema douglasi]